MAGRPFASAVSAPPVGPAETNGPVRNAVSLYPTSAATCCIAAALRPAAFRTTPAGLPLAGSSLNAANLSTWGAFELMVVILHDRRAAREPTATRALAPLLALSSVTVAVVVGG